MAPAQRRGGEVPEGNQLAFFGLIRESLQRTRAPAYVGFCANSMDPDGGEAAPMGFHQSFRQCGRPLITSIARNCSMEVKLAQPRDIRSEAVAPCRLDKRFGDGRST
jgi:hypothetical protein